MPADNVLKATVEAIAESDNEIGGTLATRLTEAHIFGQNDAFITTAVLTDRLESLVDVFSADMVGLEVDVIQKDVPTGNEGRYLIAIYENAKSVRVTTLLGAAVVFVDEDPVVWRLGTLRVETTFEFLDPPGTTETVGQLWVGLEPAVVTYADRTLAPGTNRFDQLGDYTTGVGYLTMNHREDTEVVEARRGYSALDKLRRAMLVAYAEGDELDRIGRNLGRARPWGFSDVTYRALLQVVPYAPRGTVYAIELLLAVLYPTKTPAQIQAMIYECLEQAHNTVFLRLPDTEPGLISEGRTILNPAGIWNLECGRLSGELQTSATALTFSTTQAANKIAQVLLWAVDQTLTCTVLPSASFPAWSYVNEGAVEGSVFSIVAGIGLMQTMAGGTNLGGRYRRNTITSIGTDWLLESFWLWTGTVTAGRPWHLLVHDGERSIALFWDEAGVQLHDLVSEVAVASYAFPYNAWVRIGMRRRGARVYVEVDGQVILEADASAFAASSTQDAGFGYMDLGAGAQTWVALWKNITLYSYSTKNYWNLARKDGVLNIATDDMTSAAALFLAADGDAGKIIRLSGLSPRNTGLWLVTASAAGQVTLDGIASNHPSWGPMVGTAAVSGANGDTPDGVDRLGARNGALIELSVPWFRPEDGPTVPDGPDGKSVEISGSVLGNDGTYQIQEYLDPWTVRVYHAAPGFASEAGLTWKFHPTFATETDVPWELMNTGTSVGGTSHTLREALPAATTPIEVCYTCVLSAQLLSDETVINEGSGGAEPDIWYPFYLLDVSDVIRGLIDDVTVAGVIAEFSRGY